MSKTILLSMAVDFTDNNYTNPLDCCANDAQAMIDFFVKRYNLANDQIIPMMNQNCTVDNFKSTITRYSSKLEKDDCMILFYSGHGSQVDDADRDERLQGDRNDMLDESYCFFDRMILDDEIHNALLQFKEGVKIIMIIDSCHSGKSFRDKVADASKTEFKFAETKSHEVDFSDIYKSIKADKSELKANLFFLSACQPDQLAQAGKINSLFTEEFLKILNNSKGESLDSIAHQCKSNQKFIDADQIPFCLKSDFGKESLDTIISSKKDESKEKKILLKSVNLNFFDEKTLKLVQK